MEIVRFAVAVVFVLYSVLPSSNAEPAPTSGGGGGGGDAHAMPCIQKLMPCQPYLHSVIPPPPPSCCVPMNAIVANDPTCLCAVFNNVAMLKSLNLTKENALDLPNACGAKADISLCKSSTGTTTPSTATPATPTTPPASSTETGNSSTGASASSTPTPKNSAPAINFAGLSFASAFVALATILF